MLPNDILDFNIKPCTDEDKVLALEFHSGMASHKCFINNPKYAEEGIISCIALQNSVIQLGFNWIRYIPISQPENPSLEANDSLIISSICNAFSKAINKSLRDNSNVTSVLKGLSPKKDLERLEVLNDTQEKSKYPVSILTKTDSQTSPLSFSGSNFPHVSNNGLSSEIAPLENKVSIGLDFSTSAKFSIDPLSPAFGVSPTISLAQPKLSLDNGSPTAPNFVFKRPKLLFDDGDKALIKLSSLTSASYPVGFNEPLPDEIGSAFWDEKIVDPPNKMERKLLCLILQIFKASRTPSLVSDPRFEETLTAEVQISKFLSLLVEFHTRGFHSLRKEERALCNQALWAVGMVLRRISPLKKKELREQFPILKPPPSLRLFANVLRSASRFAQVWETGTSGAPFSRISHLDCDMLRTMCTLSLPDFYALQKALLKLHDNF